MLVRDISIQQVQEVLENPQQISREAGYAVYQSVVKFGERNYRLRVFLNGYGNTKQSNYRLQNIKN